MDKLIKPGRIIFGVGTLALGMLCFISKDFIFGRPPAWPVGFELNPTLGYVSGLALIVAALAVILNRKGGLAALFIAVLILLLSVLRHLPQFMNDWVNAYKSMALLGGALIIASSFFEEDKYIISGLNATKKFRNNILAIGVMLLGIFFIVCGYAHFKFAAFVETLIPDYIPFHTFWTYFSGICLLAGGLGILIPPTRKWASLLSGIMVLGWFLLLHIPRFLSNTGDAGDRMGLCESFAFVGIFFVLAGNSSGRK